MINNNYVIKFLKTNYTINSFVLRRRNKNFSNFTDFIKKLWKKFGIDYNNYYILLQSLFNNKKPVCIDIGFGQGDFFIKKAEYCKYINFLGIEVYYSGILSALKFAEIYKLNNVKILYHNAVDVLLNMIPNKTISIIQIFFPDPWPKRKHHKRRIIQDAFVKLIAKKLVSKGIVHIKTDVPSYGDYIAEVFSKCKLFTSISLKEKDEILFFPYKTKYEKRGISLGNIIFEYIYTI